MPSTRTLRNFAAGCFAAGLFAAVTMPQARPTIVDREFAGGYGRMLRDLDDRFWDPGVFPHIRPTRGGDPGMGEVDDTLFAPSFWQMAGFANVLFRDVELTHSKESRAMLVAQWRHIRMLWSDAELSSAAPSTRIMNVSDDAAWAINYLVQTYAATGDKRALGDAKTLLPNILERWADPDAPRVALGPLLASPHGLLYATADGDPDHQGVASVYESMIANAALDIHDASPDQGELAYAKSTFAWTRRYLRQESTGLYYTELDIRPRLANGSPNAHYLKPMGDRLGPPVRGIDATYIGGTMAMGVLASRLYRLTGEADYLAEARSTASAMARNDTYLRPGGALLNGRDPWTNGYWAPAYAAEVLSLPGVDPDRRLRGALIATAKAILAQRTAQGFYGADWTGPERNPANGSMTWIEDAARRSRFGTGQALPQQIMTTATSAAMVQGGLVAEINRATVP